MCNVKLVMQKKKRKRERDRKREKKSLRMPADEPRAPQSCFLCTKWSICTANHSMGKKKLIWKTWLLQQKQNKTKNCLCVWVKSSCLTLWRSKRLFCETRQSNSPRRHCILEGLNDEAATRTTVRLVGGGRKQTGNAKWKMDHFLWAADDFSMGLFLALITTGYIISIQHSKNSFF